MASASGPTSQYLMRPEFPTVACLNAGLRGSQGRGCDDAVVRTAADPDRARQRDGHIGIALNRHHVAATALTTNRSMH
jgi:hypothetical protein